MLFTLRPALFPPVFPYTTLFRSSYLLKDATRHELFGAIRATSRGESVLAPAVAGLLVRSHRTTEQETSSPVSRSEEHTSELQSRGHLVCRLLLEKKTNGAARTER